MKYAFIVNLTDNKEDRREDYIYLTEPTGNGFEVRPKIFDTIYEARSERLRWKLFDICRYRIVEVPTDE